MLPKILILVIFQPDADASMCGGRRRGRDDYATMGGGGGGGIDDISGTADLIFDDVRCSLY